MVQIHTIFTPFEVQCIRWNPMNEVRRSLLSRSFRGSASMACCLTLHWRCDWPHLVSRTKLRVPSQIATRFGCSTCASSRLGRVACSRALATRQAGTTRWCLCRKNLSPHRQHLRCGGHPRKSRQTCVTWLPAISSAPFACGTYDSRIVRSGPYRRARIQSTRSCSLGVSKKLFVASRAESSWYEHQMQPMV